jgi:hypothetical protein
MFKEITLGTAVLCSLMVAAEPCAVAAEPPASARIVVSDTTGTLRTTQRVPAHGQLSGSPDGQSPGITVLETDGGLTVLVESLAVTGDPATPDDNDFTRIDLAVQSVAVLGDGTEVRLLGLFDWTEPNALASWAAADYAVIGPPGVAGVRIYATQLGDAEILGPWELPDLGVFYEGFLHLFGGTFDGWTIENLVVRGFDWSIGMFYDALGDFDNVTVRNNVIEVPPDIPGNHDTPSGEPFQNIAIHLAFGTGQTVEGNEIVIPGTAENTATEIASTVALQSNTSGGAGYDGLVINDNLIRVTGAQSAFPERVYGIWENAAGHSSNITVSRNLFVNEDPANDPGLNFQRAFRVTSQSSDTTTVSYIGNLASGANIGIHWIGDGYDAAPPATTHPVLVERNTLVGNGTAVWVHTDELAPDPGGNPTRMSQAIVRFNRMAGNLVGVQSDDAEVTAIDDWWGCGDGPGGVGCDVAVYSGTEGFLDADPWLVLNVSSAAPEVPVTGITTVTANLHINSDGVNTSGVDHIPDGTPVTFGADGGVMNPTQVGTSAGEAESLFTAGLVPGDFEVTATVDSATVSTAIMVTGDADLSMGMDPALQIRDDGETAGLEITVTNSGPDPAIGVGVEVDFPVELGGIGWICVGSNGGVCSNEGTGDIDDAADLPVGSSVTYTAIGAVPDPFVGILTIDGEAMAPAWITDNAPGDNAAFAEIRSLRVFEDGFESGDTSAWSITEPEPPPTR